LEYSISAFIPYYTRTYWNTANYCKEGTQRTVDALVKDS